MESTSGAVPVKRKRVQGKEKTQIPQETMLQVLRWLDRFDLDGKQITARRLRYLVENSQLPLRKLDQVNYDGDWRGHRPGKINTLSIHLEENERDGPAKVELQIESDADAQKAASCLSSCFVRKFNVFGHRDALPRNAIIAAPALIRQLEILSCNFAIGEADTLSETLNKSALANPRQILESLRLRGCNAVQLCPDVVYDLRKFHLTEDGILGYCFTLDADLPMPESRSLDIPSVNITPEFFKKVVEASKNSQLTCDVELSLDELQFDAGNLDLGVSPARSSEYDRAFNVHVHHVRYNFADIGNGIRLLIHFQRDEDDEEWEVTVRHGMKEHEEFFEPQP